MKYLFGASGHARVVIDVINSNNDNEKVDGIFDDNPVKVSFLEIPFLGKLEVLKSIKKNDELLVTIGSNIIRKEVVNRYNVSYFKAIHKNSIISKTSDLGNGSVVMSNVVINANTKIGNHTIINTSVVVEHDCFIDDFVHISPNATITGGVKIGEGTHIGAGATIIPNISIGKWCVIGAGSTVIEDVPDFSVVVGSPARFIKSNK